MPDTPPEKHFRILTDLISYDIATDFKAISDRVDTDVQAKAEEIVSQLTEAEMREWLKLFIRKTSKTEILSTVADDIMEHARIKRITPETKQLAKEIREEAKALEEFGNQFFSIFDSMPWGMMYETRWISLGKTPHNPS